MWWLYFFKEKVWLLFSKVWFSNTHKDQTIIYDAVEAVTENMIKYHVNYLFMFSTACSSVYLFYEAY